MSCPWWVWFARGAPKRFSGPPKLCGPATGNTAPQATVCDGVGTADLGTLSRRSTGPLALTWAATPNCVPPALASAGAIVPPGSPASADAGDTAQTIGAMSAAVTPRGVSLMRSESAGAAPRPSARRRNYTSVLVAVDVCGRNPAARG